MAGKHYDYEKTLMTMTVVLTHSSGVLFATVWGRLAVILVVGFLGGLLLGVVTVRILRLMVLHDATASDLLGHERRQL